MSFPFSSVVPSILNNFADLQVFTEKAKIKSTTICPLDFAAKSSGHIVVDLIFAFSVKTCRSAKLSRQLPFKKSACGYSSYLSYRRSVTV